jgi:AcrR family transcriptional regulator
MSDGPGLRERKKLSAMRRIQTVALDLFEERGFDAVTIEQIAEASEVSPSSVYRYFGSKEALVVWDEYDPAALAAIVEELDQHTPLQAIRRVVATVVEGAFTEDEERVRRRLRLTYANPSIEAHSTLQAYEMAGLIAGVIAHGAGRAPGDLDVQVFAHAYVGGLIGALRHWYESGFTTDVALVMERPLAVLERGLQLD